METGIAVNISYFTEQKNQTSIYEIEGIDQFKSELDQNYLTIIHGRPGDLGGGLGELIINLISNIELKDVVKLILDGIAFDLIKSGTKSFILRPLLEAYKKLKEKNKESDLDLSQLSIAFQNSVLKIYKISENSIIDNLEDIFISISKNYDLLELKTGEIPYEIHIPVFEDTSPDKIVRFRVLLEYDEPIKKISDEDYFVFWGISYDYSRTTKIYDVKNKYLIDEEFYDEERFWKMWDFIKKDL